MYYFPQGFAVETCIGIGKYDKRCFNEVHTPVQGSGFSLPFGLVEDCGLRPAGEALVGAVVAAVGHPDDAELVGRIVQLQAVAHFIVHYVFFVVGGYE